MAWTLVGSAALGAARAGVDLVLAGEVFPCGDPGYGGAEFHGVILVIRGHA